MILLLAALPHFTACAQPVELAAPNEPERGRFGFGVLGLPDLTGDDIGELAVASTETVNGLASAGSVYVLNGHDFSVIRRIVSPTPANGPSAAFGTAMAVLDDVNGDKTPDLLVTSMQEASAYVINGANGSLMQTLRPPVSRSGDWWGIAAAGLGGSGANAMPWVAISSPGVNAEQGDKSEIHIFDTTSGKAPRVIPNPGFKRWFGVSLANIGDVDGDGRDDLVVGAGSPVPPYHPGGAYVLSGATGRILHELIAPILPATLHQWNVAAVPDVNGDGRKDVLVGMGGSARPGAPEQSGHAYLFSGSDGKLLRTLSSPGEIARGGFGWSVAGVPDVDGDGAGELLIGAGTNPSLTGFETFGERRLHLFSGATGKLLQSFASPYAGESMGWNVTTLRGKSGALRYLIAGVRREKSLKGRVFAFPLRRLSATRSLNGLQINFLATEEGDHELQFSQDLKTWTHLSTLKGGGASATFLDSRQGTTWHRFYRTFLLEKAP